MTDIALIRDRARDVVPAVPRTIVARSRLDHRYAAAVGRVLRLLAPAGYGKSLLASAWAAAERRPVRWLDLETIDNDPVVLMSALRRGLAGIVPVDAADDLPEPGLDQRRFIERSVPVFAEYVRRCQGPFVLVLDDVHCVDQEASLALIDAVATNMGARSTLVLVGRAHHDRGSLARMRLEPGVDDLDVSDLALDIGETEALLRALGIDVDFDALSEIAAQFEGWPAGLRLAGTRLSTHGAAGPDEWAELGDLRDVTEYLQSEWVGRLPADRRQLLMEAACLDRFTAEMCDDVLERRGCATQLRDLERDRSVVLPLDARGEWYRMHPLMARWMTSELRRLDRRRADEVHRRAAAWWEAHGDSDLAVDHAHRAGDLALCERLTVRNAPLQITRGLHLTVQRWLSRFPPEHLRSSPELCALATIDALQLGDGARALRWSRTLGSSVADAPGTVDARVPSIAAVLAGTLEQRTAADLIPPLERARRALGGGAWGAFACWTLGGLMFMCGDDAATEVLDEGAFEAEVIGATVLRANCLATGALVRDVDGERDAAATMVGTAISALGAVRSGHMPTTAIVAAMDALVAARQGRHRDARDAVALARGHVAGFAQVGPWFNVLVRLATAHACLLIDDVARSKALLRELHHHLSFERATEGAADHARRLSTSVAAAEELFANRTWTLTSAELRVLQHLGTRLTLTEIAARLFVSRNTVKSHAAAIYRKLGTTSRREAVELARSAGLLAAAPDDPRVGSGG